MNKSRKGYIKELECRKILEAEGWLILFKSVRTRWFTVDFAHLFDTVAVRNTITNQEPVLEWLFVSNKHKSSYSKAHYTAIQAFKEAYGIAEGLYEVWVWNPPKWTGRGANKVWNNAKWEVIKVA